MSKSSSAGILPPPRLMGMKGVSSASSNGSNSGYFKAVDEIDRYMKQMESDNGPIGSKDVAELQLHYAKKMRQVSGCTCARDSSLACLFWFDWFLSLLM